MQSRGRRGEETKVQQQPSFTQLGFWDRIYETKRKGVQDDLCKIDKKKILSKKSVWPSSAPHHTSDASVYAPCVSLDFEILFRSSSFFSVRNMVARPMDEIN